MNSINKTIFILLFSIILSCTNQIDNKPHFNKNLDKYYESMLTKTKISEDEKRIIYELKSKEDRVFLLLLYLESEEAILEINGHKVLTDFNFTYDINIEDAINEIKLLTNSNRNLIFLFPVTTEEYLSFQILKFDQINKKFYDSYFDIETHQENIHNIYLKSKAYLTETKRNYTLKIDTFTFKGQFNEKAPFNSKLTENN